MEYYIDNSYNSNNRNNSSNSSNSSSNNSSNGNSTGNVAMSDISDVEYNTSNLQINDRNNSGRDIRKRGSETIMMDTALKGRGIATHVNELMYENERYKQGLRGMDMVEGIEDEVWWEEEEDEDNDNDAKDKDKDKEENHEKAARETREQQQREQRQRQLYALTRCQSSITTTTPFSWKQQQDKMAVYGALTLRTEMPMMAAIQPHGHTLGNMSTGMERSSSASSMGDKDQQQTSSRSRSRTRTRTYTITDVNSTANAGGFSGTGSSSLSRSVSMTPCKTQDANQANNGSPAMPKPKWRVMPMSRTALALVDKAMLVRVNNKYIMAVEVKEQPQPIEMAPVQFIGPRCRSLPINAMKAGDCVSMPTILDLSMVKKIGAGF